jgi:hypothetical protein
MAWSAANAMAGAVLRAAGSSTMAHPTHSDRATLLRNDEAMLFVADQIRSSGVETLDTQQVSCSIV